MTDGAVARQAVTLIFSCLVLIMGSRPVSAQTHSFEMGAARISWLTKSVSTSISAQSRVAGSTALAIVVGMRGSFNLQDGSELSGATALRTDIATAVLGVEARLIQGTAASLHASASAAGSWLRYKYSDPTLNSRNVNGGGWVGGIYGLRAKFGSPSSSGISLRAEVRPRYGDLASLNPYVGVGWAF